MRGCGSSFHFLTQNVVPAGRQWITRSSSLRFFSKSYENPTDLISSLCDGGRAMEAFKLLSTVNVKESSSKLDIYGKVLNSLVTSSNMSLALQLIEQMKIEFPLHQASYDIILKSLCKAGCIDDACRHLTNMGRIGCAPDNGLVDELVSDFCKTGKWKSCYQILHKLCDVGFTPPLATFNAFFNSLSRAGLMPQACKLLDDIVSLGFIPDVYTYGIMLHTLCTADKVDEAHRLLKAMHGQKCEPDVVCYSAVLHGYVRLNKPESALKILDEMLRHKCSPDVVTYNSLISMFSKVGDIKRAYERWDQMKASGCVPDHISYTAMLDGLCRQTRGKECLNVLLEMLKKKLMPGALLKRKLQECLQRHGVNVDMLDVIQEVRKYGIDLREDFGT